MANKRSSSEARKSVSKVRKPRSDTNQQQRQSTFRLPDGRTIQIDEETWQEVTAALHRAAFPESSAPPEEDQINPTAPSPLAEDDED